MSIAPSYSSDVIPPPSYRSAGLAPMQMAAALALNNKRMVWSTEVRKDLRFYLNGQLTVQTNPNPDEKLIEYVRRMGYTGTKLGCAEGISRAERCLSWHPCVCTCLHMALTSF